MFLLVPAHPGCPGQIPQSRKTGVCVCKPWFYNFFFHHILVVIVVIYFVISQLQQLHGTE